MGGLTERQQFKQLSPTARSRFQLVLGHMEFGLHSHLSEPVSYFTLLREPVSRVVSYYYFQKTRKLDPLHSAAKKFDLKAYIGSDLDPLVDNFQIQMLAAKWHSVPAGQLPASTLETAKRHLQEYFTVVGLTERFDETLIPLQQAYG
jgi:hypothetical protein